MITFDDARIQKEFVSWFNTGTSLALRMQAESGIFDLPKEWEEYRDSLLEEGIEHIPVAVKNITTFTEAFRSDRECSKGYTCGAACITRSKACLKNLTAEQKKRVNSLKGKARLELATQLNAENAQTEETSGSSSTDFELPDSVEELAALLGVEVATTELSASQDAVALADSTIARGEDWISSIEGLSDEMGSFISLSAQRRENKEQIRELRENVYGDRKKEFKTSERRKMRDEARRLEAENDEVLTPQITASKANIDAAISTGLEQLQDADPRSRSEVRSKLEDDIEADREITDAAIEVFLDDATAFSRMTGVDFESENIDMVGSDGDRAYYSSSADQSGAGFLSLGYGGSMDEFSEFGRLNIRGTAFHEMGHMLETSRPEIELAMQGFLEKRATGDPQRLSDLTGEEGYGSSEIAVPDNFISPYVGKIYVTGGDEVFSVGMEHLADPKTASVLALIDREHFALTVGAILSIKEGRN